MCRFEILFKLCFPAFLITSVVPSRAVAVNSEVPNDLYLRLRFDLPKQLLKIFCITKKFLCSSPWQPVVAHTPLLMTLNNFHGVFSEQGKGLPHLNNRPMFLLLLLVTQTLPRDEGMAEDHGAPEAGKLPRVRTRGRRERVAKE